MSAEPEKLEVDESKQASSAAASTEDAKQDGPAPPDVEMKELTPSNGPEEEKKGDVPDTPAPPPPKDTIPAKVTQEKPRESIEAGSGKESDAFDEESDQDKEIADARQEMLATGKGMSDSFYYGHNLIIIGVDVQIITVGHVIRIESTRPAQNVQGHIILSVCRKASQKNQAQKIHGLAPSVWHLLKVKRIAGILQTWKI